MEARGKAEEAKDKAEDAKESASNKSIGSTPATTSSPSPATDGMTQLKEFFSGDQGLKRSEIFLKFAKMITDGAGPAEIKPSLAQKTTVKKHKKKKIHKQKRKENTALQVEN